MIKGRRRRLLALFLTGTILFQSLTVNATETESDAGWRFIYRYDHLERISEIGYRPSENGTYTALFSYHYGKDGNLAYIKDLTEGKTYRYYYDLSDRLVKTVVSDGSFYTYYYDVNDNLVKVDEGDSSERYVTEYIYDSDNRETVTKVNGSQSVQLKSVTSGGSTISYTYDGKAITYDAIGNPLSYLGKTMTWTKGKMLETVSDSQMDYTYTYNIDDLRTEKKNNKTGEVTAYQMTDGVIAAQTTKDSAGKVKNKMVFTYDSNDSIIAMRYNGTQYFYQKNGQDDIIGIVDGGGKVVVQYSYDSWGKLLDITGDTALGNANPFRYRSYYYDNETGFYYLGGRYYDAEVGRFINADTTDLLTVTPERLTDKNLYAYCDNNPVVRKDEGGQFWLVSAVLGAAKGIVTDFITSKITGQKYTAKDILISAVKGAVNTVSSSINAKNLAILTNVPEETISKSASMAINATVGFGASCISAATNKAIKINSKPKKSNKRKISTDSYTTFKLKREIKNVQARRRLV